jgi:uridine kinase
VTQSRYEVTIRRLLEGWRQCRGDRRHLFIGIGGGSAAGKTTVARDVRQRLAPRSVEIICQDRFFKPVGEIPTYESATHDGPRPDYNQPDSFRRAPMFDYCRQADGADVVILEGILVLHFPELRDLMDVKCYVSADVDERIVRRIGRNLSLWPFDEIANYYLESVRHQHERYNAPTQRYADLVISGGMAEAEERGVLLSVLCDAILDCMDA